MKNHPDKWHGLSEDEKTVAMFIIKEYGNVLQSTDKVQ